MKSKYNLIKKTILIIAFAQLTALFGFHVKIYGETINKVIDYGAGSGFSVVLDEKGDIWSWGSNEYGQLGLGDTIIRNEPTRILVSDDGNVLPKFSKVAAGYGITLCLDIHGDLWSFGNRDSGQLGIGDITSNMLRPYKITLGEGGLNLPKFNKIKLDYLSSFAIDTDGNLWAWGNGYQGDRQIYSPKKVEGVSDVLDVVADNGTYYALDNYGEVYFWGENMDHSTLNVPTLFKSQLPLIKQISCGNKSLLTLDENGLIKEIKNHEEVEYLFGVEEDHTVELPIFKFISRRKDETLAIDEDGNLWSFGDEKDYENIKYPTKINDFYEDVKFVSLCRSIDIPNTKANSFILALDENNHIWSWGNNENNVTATGVQYTNIEKPTLTTFSQSDIEVAEAFNESEVEVSVLEEDDDNLPKIDSITLIAQEDILEEENDDMPNTDSITLTVQEDILEEESDDMPNTDSITLVAQEDSVEEKEVHSFTINDVLNKDKIITGTGKKGAKIQIVFSNYDMVNSMVSESGTWEAYVTEGLELTGNIIAMQTDEKGNAIQVSTSVLTETELIDNMVEDEGLKAPFVNSVSESDKVITGTGRVNNLVSVNFKGSDDIKVKAKVEKDGTWKIAIPKGVNMSGEIFAIEEDENGNESPETKIFVKNSKTIIIGDVAINANDFKANIKDVDSFTDEDIIKNSGVKAWNVTSGADLIDKVKVDKSAVRKEPGTYPIMISVDMLKASLEKDDLNQDAVIVHMTVGDANLPSTGEMFFKLQIIKKPIGI